MDQTKAEQGRTAEQALGQLASTLHVATTSRWQRDLFQRLVDFRNDLYCGEPFFLKESLGDLEKIFAPPSPFSSFMRWQAIIVTSEPGLQGRILGRMIACCQPDASDTLNCGYYDAVDDVGVARALFNQAEAFARANGCHVLKAPVQATFWNSYRITLSGSEEPLWCDPYLKDYYHEHFQSVGLELTKRWVTTKLTPRETAGNFSAIRRSTRPRNQQLRGKLRVRYLRFDRWNQEAEIVHDLTSRSYQNMSEYEPLPLSAFKVLTEDFRYIGCRWASFIVEHDQEPVGFCINYFDPLRVLVRHQDREPLTGFPRVGDSLLRARLLAELKLNFQKLLIGYVGKVPTADGREVKGAQAAVAPRLYALFQLARVDQALVCFSAEDSPANRSFDERYRIPVSTYGLYARPLVSKAMLKE
jgi:hypothetical protein